MDRETNPKPNASSGLPVRSTPIAVEDDRRADKPSAKESFSASEELLKAVKNWTQVPSTVFPLGGVEVFQDFTVRIRDSKGQELASNRILAGNMVVVLSVQGTTLVVSDSETSKMRGRIEMHATNFKRKVAELFEYRKKQREEYLHLQIKPSEEPPVALPDESTGELPNSETSPSTSPD